MDGQQLNELSYMGWPLSDNDLLIMEDVSDPLPLRKIRLSTLRSAFMGGWPSLADVPEGALTPPTWNLKGVEGGWRIRIGADVIAETDWYFIHKLNHDTGLYDAVYAVAEHRDPGEKGPLEYTHLAEETDPPDRYYGTFKVQAVSADFQGALSAAQSAWTLYDLPSDWLPNAPTLLTTGGYPLISRSLLPDGGLGYTISLKIQAPADQKNFLKEYVIDRVCDEGGSFEGKPTKTKTLVLKATPRAKIVIFDDTDRSFVPGYQYRYTVYARALSPNNNLGPVSNTQDKTLTDDTTAPDNPVFTVKTSPGNIEVTFDPIEVGGNPDVGWAYIQLQYRIDAGAWTDIILDKTLSYVFSIPEDEYSDEYEFQAKVFDYAGNANAGGWQTDPAKYTAGVITVLTFGTDLTNEITQITTNEGNITTHSSEISQNASNILLRVSKNDVINQINISTEEILIDGDTLHITAATTFDADVEIQGLLKAAGGLKTAASGDRIEIGKFGGAASLKGYDSINKLRVNIQTDYVQLLDTSEDVKVSLSSSAIIVASPAYIQAGTIFGTTYVSAGHFRVGANQVVGARAAHIPDAPDASAISLTAGSDHVNISVFNSALTGLKNEINAINTVLKSLLASDETHGLRAVA